MRGSRENGFPLYTINDELLSYLGDEDREAIISIVLEGSDTVKNEEKLEYEAAYDDTLTNVRNRKGGVRFIAEKKPAVSKNPLPTPLTASIQN